MERVQLTPPGENRERGARARLYVRWMPHLGAEAVALYELLRLLPDVGQDSVEFEELADLLRSTPEGVEAAMRALEEHGFMLERWVERGVKTVADVERFEQDRRIKLVEGSGAVRGGALRIGEGVRGGADRGSAARRREGYEWLFGE